jgi:hypothetical protein
MEAPKIDKHDERWSGYFKGEKEAQDHLDSELKHLSKDNLIISARKELNIKGKAFNGLLLYRFFVKTAEKDNT